MDSNSTSYDQVEGYLTRAREAEQLTIAAEALFRGAREEAEAGARASRDALEVSNLASFPLLGVFTVYLCNPEHPPFPKHTQRSTLLPSNERPPIRCVCLGAAC